MSNRILRFPMAEASEQKKDQTHPLWAIDRAIVDTLLASEATDYHIAELARLRIRYQDFPGARDIQADLEKLLQKWGFTETTLYAKTREIHAATPVYRGKNARQEDWS